MKLIKTIGEIETWTIDYNHYVDVTPKKIRKPKDKVSKKAGLRQTKPK